MPFVFVASVALMVGTAAATPFPSDIETIATLTNSAQSALTPDGLSRTASRELTATFSRALVRACDAASTEAGVGGVADDDRLALHRMAHAAVERWVGQAGARRPRSSQAEALEELVRRVTARSSANAIVDAWLGHEPLPPPKSEKRRVNLSRQLVASDSGHLRLLLDKSTVEDELGGAGEGNGRIDAGEWVRLRLVLRNQSRLPWFSSSVFVESDDPCVWTDPLVEHELAEMPVDGEAQLLAWIYVSDQCPSRAPRSLRLRVRDTHRTGNEGTSIEFHVKPMQVPRPQLTNQYFDTDVPGSSDGSRALELTPGLQFEYSANVLASAEVASVRLAWNVPPALSPLFSSLEHRTNEMQKSAGPLFIALDDLDGEVAPETKARSALQTASVEGRRWAARTTDAAIWLSATVTMAVPAPDETERITTPQPTPQPIAAPLKAVLSLVHEHLDLRARPAAPLLEHGVRAVDGYELTFEDEAFGRAYLALIQPPTPPPSKTDAPVLIEYRHRFFERVPLAPIAPAELHRAASRPSAPRPQAEPSPKAVPVENPEPAPPEPNFRLDLSGGWASYDLEPRLFWSRHWGSETSTLHLAQGALRLTAGHALRGFIEGQFGGTRNETAAMNEFLIGGGIALGGQMNAFEGELSAGVHFRYRRLVSATELIEGPSASGSFGVSGRWWFHPHVAVGAHAESRFGPSAPAGMLSGLGVRLSAGLSARF